MTVYETEQLSTGYAGIKGGDGEQLSTQVRINPIGEGDITVGSSENRTYWDAEVLREAVESGVFDGAEIIKGRGGSEPHFPMDEHVPPENKLGRVDDWEYQEGVGPVGIADIVDSDIADRIGLGLLDVSADMLRVLGSKDMTKDAYTVDEIVAVPRITILDRGASRSASIQPAQAEALGLNPDEFISENLSDDRNVLIAMWEKLSNYFETDSETNMSKDNQFYIDSKDKLSHDDKSERNEDTVGSENTENMTEDNQKLRNELHELKRELSDKEHELSDKEQKVSELDEKVEELNGSIEDLESDVSGKDEEIESLSDKLENKDEEIENLSELVKPVEEMMAEIVAGESEMLTAETVADKYDLHELVDMLASSEADEDKSYTEKVKEQLQGNIRTKGDSTGSEDKLTEDDLEQLEDMSYSALTARDLRAAEKAGQTAHEYLRDTLDVDVTDCENERQVRQRVMNAKGN